MPTYEWKILGIEAKDGVITAARYFVAAKDQDITVATEGYWPFQEPKASIPFAEVTETMVVDWIKDQATKDGKSLITTRLDEQVQHLKAQNTVVAPWLPQTFKPKI